MSKLAIGYIRVSTTRQAEEGNSLEAQRARIKSWCEAKGHELKSVYIDAGLSGGRADNRPELQLAIEEACRLKSVLVVYSLSRLARSTRDAIDISERLDRCGANLVSLTESIDTTTAVGVLFFQMIAALAQFEREQIRERTCSALAYLKSQGRRVSRWTPFGFDLAEDGETLTVNQDERRIIDGMGSLRRQGWSYHAISHDLNWRKFPAKQGGQWGVQTVRRILLREGVHAETDTAAAAT